MFAQVDGPNVDRESLPVDDNSEKVFSSERDVVSPEACRHNADV